ncbi:MAG: hypothetical protein ACK5HR_01850 [Mycoplasmatales bacterium]
MKKIIILLSVILAVMIIFPAGLVICISQNDFYNTVDHIKFKNILDEPKGDHLYYFYEKKTEYCDDLEPEMEEFVHRLDSTDKIDIKFIDMRKKANEDGWEEDLDKVYEVEKTKTLDDFKVVGVPAMLHVKDGVAVEYKENLYNVEEMMDEIEAEYDI